ncbi:hypothetical protein AYK26_07860 [Euryarchaeota archaeon SM23-78]|nr:MAG: hypothetical protein AYK26_07860 [Euryarchaeota archaeon SM23-78]
MFEEGEKEQKPVPKSKGRAGVPEHKKKLVQTLVNLIDKNNIIAMVNMENLPAKQLGVMRAQLRGKVVLLMTKKRFIMLALEQSKKHNIKELEKYVKGMPALLFTDQNPFALFKLIKKNKSTAPIKPGQKAPNDIIVQAGPTSFSPGPIIGELGSFRIKAGIESGKVVIKSDAIVAKEGEEVNEKLAALLTRLGIEPMKIGLNIVAVYEKGEILTKDVLDVDEEALINNMRTVASECFNLAMFIVYPVKDTIKLLLSKAHNEAKAVVKEAKVMTGDNVGEVLAKAEATASALKAKVTEKQSPSEPSTELKVPEAPKEEKKEEKPKEEAKKEETTEAKKASEPAAEPQKPAEKKEKKEAKKEKPKKKAKKEKPKKEKKKK